MCDMCVVCVWYIIIYLCVCACVLALDPLYRLHIMFHCQEGVIINNESNLGITIPQKT